MEVASGNFDLKQVLRKTIEKIEELRKLWVWKCKWSY